MACGILVPRAGIKLASPALEGGFLTTGPPGKSLEPVFLTTAVSGELWGARYSEKIEMEVGVAGEVVGPRSRGPLSGGGWGLNEKEAAALRKVLVVWILGEVPGTSEGLTRACLTEAGGCG